MKDLTFFQGFTRPIMVLFLLAGSTPTMAQMLVKNSANAEIIRITQTGVVGLGVTNPLSKISLNGNQSIGATYGTILAPNDGLLVEGLTGIGVTNPGAKLHVIGNGSYTNPYNPNPILPSILVQNPSSSSTDDGNYVAIESQLPYMDFDSGNINNGLRLAVHGVIIDNPNNKWLA